MAAPVFTLANQLTLLRMGLAPLLVILVLSQKLRWALVVFIVAGVTDLLDGLIARLGHQQTTLGAMLDPVADKVLLTSAFVALTWTSHLHLAIPVWLTVTTLSRDAIILTGERLFRPQGGTHLRHLDPSTARALHPGARPRPLHPRRRRRHSHRVRSAPRAGRALR